MEKVKVSFNLLQEDVNVLRALAAKRGTSVTEALRHAIATEKFIQAANAKGEKILIESEDKKAPLRQLLVG